MLTSLMINIVVHEEYNNKVSLKIWIIGQGVKSKSMFHIQSIQLYDVQEDYHKNSYTVWSCLLQCAVQVVDQAVHIVTLDWVDHIEPSLRDSDHEKAIGRPQTDNQFDQQKVCAIDQSKTLQYKGSLLFKEKYSIIME